MSAHFVVIVGVSNTQWGSVEGSPPHQVTSGRRTRSSTSRSESSNSEAMLSPDPSSSNTQPSLVASAVDIFGDSSPTNNSSAYRERLDALGATFQNIEQNFQVSFCISSRFMTIPNCAFSEGSSVVNFKATAKTFRWIYICFRWSFVVSVVSFSLALLHGFFS